MSLLTPKLAATLTVTPCKETRKPGDAQGLKSMQMADSHKTPACSSGPSGWPNTGRCISV